jgi:hypothetical protein
MPDTDLIARLRLGKEELRHSRRQASLDEKLLELVRAQRLHVEIVSQRRKLGPLEHPWDLGGDVSDENQTPEAG